MEGYEANTYGDRFADVYDAWYGDITDVAACIERLADIVAEAGGGPVLELGIGSGRLALPLAARGIEVHGVDASEAMVTALGAKPGAEAVTVTVGDMAQLALEGSPPFAVVLVAFNTFFNLPTEAAQRSCLAAVARLLSPNGRFVLEAYVPDMVDGAAIDGVVSPRHLSVDEVVLSVSQRDRDAQTVTGQHVHITEAGIRLRPWHLRYATPEQLDAMARDAGLELASRESGWEHQPFTDSSGVHVSTYRLGSFAT
jgi:SAM-dependent methyltransferase